MFGTIDSPCQNSEQRSQYSATATMTVGSIYHRVLGLGPTTAKHTYATTTAQNEDGVHEFFS